ncbi:hypothetical protein AC1031_018126 [Aphanomyces cochlioides]|nr:hypothetical protein AC1031_011254 [Aphanomyces cochlioides]KAG9410092.1 hypothetical protein AC1031_018126 [Aphanomyces cochlioides]
MAGESGASVSARTKIPYNTLMAKLRSFKAGTLEAPKRRGPPPLLPPECETDLVAWIGAMQQDGYPIDRQAIIIKANQLLKKLDPDMSVSDGWYKRFMQRHPALVNRSAQYR